MTIAREAYNDGGVLYLSAAVTDVNATTIQVSSTSSPLPAYPSQATWRIGDELILITAASVMMSGADYLLTVVRGQEGTLKKTYSNGTILVAVLSAGSLTRLVSVSVNGVFIAQAVALNILGSAKVGVTGAATAPGYYDDAPTGVGYTVNEPTATITITTTGDGYTVPDVVLPALPSPYFTDGAGAFSADTFTFGAVVAGSATTISTGVVAVATAQAPTQPTSIAAFTVTARLFAAFPFINDVFYGFYTLLGGTYTLYVIGKHSTRDCLAIRKITTTTLTVVDYTLVWEYALPAPPDWWQFHGGRGLGATNYTSITIQLGFDGSQWSLVDSVGGGGDLFTNYGWCAGTRSRDTGTLRPEHIQVRVNSWAVT